MKTSMLTVIAMAAVVGLQACGGDSGSNVNAVVGVNTSTAGSYGTSADPTEALVAVYQSKYGDIFPVQQAQLDPHDSSLLLASRVYSWDDFYHSTIITLINRCGNTCLLNGTSGNNPFNTTGSNFNLNVQLFDSQYIFNNANNLNNDGVEFRNLGQQVVSSVGGVMQMLLPQY